MSTSAHADLVLLHGTSGFSEDWSQVLQHLGEHRDVIRPDFTQSTLTIEEAASKVLSAVDGEGGHPLDLAGYSLGAGVAAFIAAEYPERVRSLALVSGFAYGSDSRMRLQFDLWLELARNNRAALAKLLFLTGFSRDFLAMFDEGTTSRLMDGFVASGDWPSIVHGIQLGLALDVREQARRITVPTVVITSKYDAIVPGAYSQELAELIPDAKWAQIVSGHLSFLEQPAALAATITAFLDSVSQG